MEETKLDKVLSQVLTISGQMTILQGQIKNVQGQMKDVQGQMNNMEARMDNMEKEQKEFRKETKERFDKIEQDHKEFKESLDIALERNFRVRDKVIKRHTKEIRKLQHKPAIIACVKTRLKKLVSKTN